MDTGNKCIIGAVIVGSTIFIMTVVLVMFSIALMQPPKDVGRVVRVEVQNSTRTSGGITIIYTEKGNFNIEGIHSILYNEKVKLQTGMLMSILYIGDKMYRIVQ